MSMNFAEAHIDNEKVQKTRRRNNGLGRRSAKLMLSIF